LYVLNKWIVWYLLFRDYVYYIYMTSTLMLLVVVECQMTYVLVLTKLRWRN